jgi:hypothetical protein
VDEEAVVNEEMDEVEPYCPLQLLEKAPSSKAMLL